MIARGTLNGFVRNFRAPGVQLSLYGLLVLGIDPVDTYEAKHDFIDAPDPVAAIQFRMEQQQLSRKDLEPLIGSRARISEF